MVLFLAFHLFMFFMKGPPEWRTRFDRKDEKEKTTKVYFSVTFLHTFLEIDRPRCHLFLKPEVNVEANERERAQALGAHGAG